MKTQYNIMTFFIIVNFILLSCTNNKEIENMENSIIELQKISQSNIAQIKEINSKKIFFGHMSVGNNILNGVNRINTKYSLQIDVNEIDNGVNKERVGISHAYVGFNKRPNEKIESFSKFITDTLKGNVDVALFKFCYIDFNEDTDVDALFKKYSSTIKNLKTQYPKITFVHTTAPLRAIQKGPKAFAKKILGKSIGYEDNIVRNQFNKLILEEYSQSDKIFDIAKFESTYQDGRREVKIINDIPIYSLIKKYTYDGGHLNEFGEDYLGEQFLLFLAQI